MPPTPLSPDFDPLATSCDLAALSGFGGSLHPCCPKTAPGFARCSVRIVSRRSSLRSASLDLPEGTSSVADRFTPRTRKSVEYRILLRSDRLATFLPRRRSGRTTRGYPVHRGLLHRPARKPPWYRAVPPGLIRRSTRASRFGRRGRARSSEESQHSRPPAALRKSDAEAPYLRFAASVPFPLPRLPGSTSSVPLQLAIVPPEGFPAAFRNVRYLVRTSRFRVPLGRSRAAIPTPKPLTSPLRIGCAFRRSSS